MVMSVINSETKAMEVINFTEAKHNIMERMCYIKYFML